jgi:hypothetical protein
MGTSVSGKGRPLAIPLSTILRGKRAMMKL